MGGVACMSVRCDGIGDGDMLDRELSLFTQEGWTLYSDTSLPPMIWVWHKACQEIPNDETYVNQHSWLTMDDHYRCILCEKMMPDELVTVIVLYK